MYAWDNGTYRDSPFGRIPVQRRLGLGVFNPLDHDAAIAVCPEPKPVADLQTRLDERLRRQRQRRFWRMIAWPSARAPGRP